VSNVVRPTGETTQAPQTFGTRLRQLRGERGLRQRDLVGDNISASYISLLEADRRVPTDRVVRHLSKRLGCPLEDLWLPDEETARRPAVVELRMARAALTVGKADEAEAWYRRVLMEHDGDTAISQEAEFGLARAAEQAGRHAQAAEGYRACLDAAEDPAYPHRIGATMGLVRSLAHGDDAASAVAAALLAKRQVQEAGLNVSDVAVEICAILATVLCERGDYAAAEEPVVEALKIVPKITDHQALTETYWQAAADAYEANQTGYAQELASRITDIDAHDYGHTLGMLRAVYGSLLLRQSPPDPQKAREMLEVAVADLDASGAVGDAMRCRSDLVRALIMLDDCAEALTLADAILGDADTPPMERIRAQVLRATTQCLLDDTEAARAACHASRAELEDQPRGSQTSQLWSLLGETMTQVGDTEGAIHAYRRAINGLGVDLPPTLLPAPVRKPTDQNARRQARGGSR
jgi:tetratricopeptide (TPR) repeat protein